VTQDDAASAYVSSPHCPASVFAIDDDDDDDAE
jgi:hypothetical protein